MTESTELPAAGWNDDPEDAAQLRYWDGSAWTEHRSPKAGVTSAVAAQPAAMQPAAATVMVQGAAAPKRSGAPWWLVAVTAVVALLIGGGIGAGVGVVASRGDDTVAAPATTPNEAPAADDLVVDETTSADPAPAAGGGGTAADPLAIDTPWTYDTSWFGEEGTLWEGTLEGLVSLPVYEYEADQDARCFAIVGTMAPTSIAGGAFTNDTFDTPSFEVIVDGQVAGDFGSCNTDGLAAAGYGSMWDASLSVGTEYRFYSEVFVPSTVTGDVELIVLGSASDSEAVFYKATPISVG